MNASREVSSEEHVWCACGSWQVYEEHVITTRAVDISGFARKGNRVIVGDLKVLKSEEIKVCSADDASCPNQAYRYIPNVWKCGECGKEFSWSHTTTNGSGLAYWAPKGRVASENEAEAHLKANQCCTGLEDF